MLLELIPEVEKSIIPLEDNKKEAVLKVQIDTFETASFSI